MKQLEFTKMEDLQGGAWKCSNAGDWFGVAGLVLLGVATVATGGTALAIVAGTWSTLATVTGGAISAGNLVAGC